VTARPMTAFCGRATSHAAIAGTNLYSDVA